MMAEKIKERINEICTCFTFNYMGKDYGIDPISHTLFFVFEHDGDDVELHSIDEVMNNPFFNGKCLSEIANEIEILDW